MTHTFDIETELQKIVSMTEIVHATTAYTVNWEDVLSELEAYAEKGSAPRDTARFIADIVPVIRERAEYIDRFITFDTTSEAAEYLVLYALCKVGIASTGENPTPFIDAALRAEAISVEEHLRRALIDASFLLLDETGALSALICQTCELVEDPTWVTHVAVEQACKSMAKTLEM